MVYIIAEAGVDHEGSYERATYLIHAAAEANADCIKFQYYKQGFSGAHRELPWLLPRDMHRLEIEAQYVGIDFLLTPHDEWALQYVISDTEIDTIKIGSGDWHLLDAAIDSCHEIIVSTGGHSWRAVMALEGRVGAILYCVSKYPCLPENLYLGDMREWISYMENTIIGFSDHTRGTACALAATGIGAEIIEKHITLERDINGRNDTFCSLLPDEWPQFVRDIRSIEQALVR